MFMRLGLLTVSITLAVSACAEPVPVDTDIPAPAPARLSAEGAPRTPVDALAPYYAQLEYEAPVAPEGLALPGPDTVLTSIAFGSSMSVERDSPILNTIAEQGHDLFVFAGDTVYGDTRRFNADLPELRERYAVLSRRPEFRLLRSAAPTLAIWDDHDYGMVGLGRYFPFKGFSQTLFLDFWGAEPHDVRRTRDGVYDAKIFGPQGQRVQVILLDTRYFRSDLTVLNETDNAASARYEPSQNPDQDMLGASQWAWLADQLREPADVRLIVSSLQVVADGHDKQAWRTMPMERDRLYRLIGETGAAGVMFLSGEHWSAGLYRREGVAPYSLYEITSSALNIDFDEDDDATAPHRISEPYGQVNYGVITVNWDMGQVGLQIRNLQGETVREQQLDFTEIGLR